MNRKDFKIDTWFERDRSYVGLTNKDDVILEFWDNDVVELIEDGFIDPKNYLVSMLEYANYLGVIKGARICKEI